MGKKGDLSNFERGMVVGARWASLSISHNLLSYWDFHAHPFLGFRKGKNIQYPFLWAMLEVRGEWADWFKLIEEQLSLK